MSMLSMQKALADRRISILIFAMIAASVGLLAAAVSGSAYFLDAPTLLSAAITFDLLVTVPVAFYLLVARRFSLSIVTVAPVAGAGWLAAYVVLPVDHQGPLAFAEFGVAVVEVAAVAWIVRRVWLAAREKGSRNADPLANLRRISKDVLGSRRFGSIFAAELAMFYYAVGAWRARPHLPHGADAFSCYKKSGQGALVFGILLLITAEGLVVHLVVSKWSVAAAWVITALTIYGGLWLLGDYRATVLRPMLLQGDSLEIRAGLRYNFSIPIEAIDSVVRTRPETGPDVSVTLLSGPTHWIVFNRVITAEGMFGFTKEIRAVGLTPDDPEGFEQAMDPAVSRKARG